MALTDRPAASTTVEPRFPCFDGLRAMAALAVFMTHTADSGGANAPNLFGIFFARMDGGVAVFFVLSGMLIYRPFARAHIFGETTPRLAGYLWRRALRIYPAYWLALTVVVFVFGHTSFPNLRTALLDYSLLHIYSPHQPDVFAPLIQSWTLSTELTFYAFVPLWALVMRRLARGDVRSRLRAQLVGVVALVAASALWKAFVLARGFDDGRIGQLKMWLPWWLDLFAAGMAMAVVSLAVTRLGDRTPLRLDSRWAPLACWLGALGALWWVAAGAGLGHTSGSIAHHLLWGQHYLYAAVAVLLVLPAVFGPQDRGSSRIRGFLQTRVMVFLGLISYGIYLWHEAWIQRYLDWVDVPYRAMYTSNVPFEWHTNSVISIPWFTFVLAALALTVATATVSWFALERPVLRFKHRFDR